MLYVKPVPDVDILFTIVIVYLSVFFSHSCCLPVSGEIKLYIYNLAHPASSRRLGYMFCCCLFFNDFCQTNCLNIYRTDHRQIYRICKTLVINKRLKVSFSIHQWKLPWQPILWVKSKPNTHSWIRVTLARAAYNKKCNFCARCRQAN